MFESTEEGKKWHEVWKEMIVFATGVIITSWLYGKFAVWAGIAPLY